MRARSLVVLRDEVVNVRAFERQELAAVDAPAVILGRREGGAELVAGHRFGELGGIHWIVHRSPEVQWGTAAGPGLSGGVFGTRATSLRMWPGFLGPTRACT